MASTRTLKTLRRVLGLAVALAQRSTHGARVADLVSQLDSSRATVYRDFDTLRDVGLDVEHCEIGGERRVRLVPSHKMPSTGPDFREQLALKLMRQANPNFEGTFVSEALDALMRPSAGARGKPLSGPRKAGPTAEILDTIARAIRTKVSLRHACVKARG